MQQKLSPQQIISALQAMPLAELEQTLDQALKVRAARRAPHVSADESNLLEIIARRLPERETIRMRELQRLRDDEQLTSEGYAELAGLLDHLEEMHAERMIALAKLADSRGVTLESAMKQIGLKLPDYE